MKLAIAGFVHETVSFLPGETTLEQFEAVALRGPDLIDRLRGSNTVFGGFIDVCEHEGVEMVGLVASDVWPSGPVSETAFDHFTNEIVDGVAALSGKIDGLLLHLHGAMATALRQDPESDILRRLRERTGGDFPIGLALDLHGNLSAETCRLADIVCGFRHSPHTDMAETGRRTAGLLLRAIRGEISPVVAMRKPGIVLPSVFTATEVEPLRSIMQAARTAEAEPGILDVSVFTGFAYCDVASLGASVVAVADRDELAAARVCDGLTSMISAHRHDLYRRDLLLTPEEAVGRAMQSAAEGTTPVVILEHADRGNDSTYVLDAAMQLGARRVAVPYLTDPRAVSVAAQAGVGGQVMLTLGGQSSEPAGRPVLFGGQVRFVGEKRYRATGPYRTGEPIDLGPCAVLDNGAVTVIAISRNVVAVDTDPFTQFGLDVADFDIVILRSKTHFRAAWQKIAADILIAETPDWGLADLARLPYRNAPPGLFPVTAD
jgi:microcystin degradation protein MlrC